MHAMTYVKPPKCQLPIDGQTCRRKTKHAGECMGHPTMEEILTFEAAHPQHTGNKETLIRDHFDLAPARYYQLLGQLLTTPEALAYDPVTVNRCHRQRAERIDIRQARQLARSIYRNY